MRITDTFDKYRKLTKILRSLSQLGYWGCAVLFGIMLCLAVIVTVKENVPILLSMSKATVSLDGVLRFNLAMADIAPNDRQKVMAALLYAIATFAAVYGLILFYLTGLLLSVEEGKPFTKDNARRLSAMAVVFIIGSFIVGIAYAATAYVTINAMQLTAVSVNFQSNTTMLTTGFLILILAGIFNYGSHLQEEYDSTL